MRHVCGVDFDVSRVRFDGRVGRVDRNIGGRIGRRSTGALACDVLAAVTGGFDEGRR